MFIYDYRGPGSQLRMPYSLYAKNITWCKKLSWAIEKIEIPISQKLTEICMRKSYYDGIDLWIPIS